MWAAAALLFGGGIVKLRNPLGPIPAMRAAGLPAHRLLVVALGVAEVVLSTICILAPSTIPLVLMGLLYVAFAAFIARLASLHAPGISCGCAGRRHIPPSYLHAVMNLLAAAAILTVAAAPGISPIDLSHRDPFTLLGIVSGVAGITWAAYLVVAYVPSLFSSWERA
jgi:hypothetical protein